eukprot:TRINITY_DN4588_c0_g1_i6.p1 TRINITY_DN4588_c0_g1~~TRINITY_DN4588_c0_g1_i6.p1  ORF type:complete len:549 (+),score=85.66 TRINITY_DN4588_c0_g1_i6:42-1649(+)
MFRRCTVGFCRAVRLPSKDIMREAIGNLAKVDKLISEVYVEGARIEERHERGVQASVVKLLEVAVKDGVAGTVVARMLSRIFHNIDAIIQRGKSSPNSGLTTVVPALRLLNTLGSYGHTVLLYRAVLVIYPNAPTSSTRSLVADCAASDAFCELGDYRSLIQLMNKRKQVSNILERNLFLCLLKTKRLNMIRPFMTRKANPFLVNCVELILKQTTHVVSRSPADVGDLISGMQYCRDPPTLAIVLKWVRSQQPAPQKIPWAALWTILDNCCDIFTTNTQNRAVDGLIPDDLAAIADTHGRDAILPHPAPLATWTDISKPPAVLSLTALFAFHSDGRLDLPPQHRYVVLYSTTATLLDMAAKSTDRDSQALYVSIIESLVQTDSLRVLTPAEEIRLLALGGAVREEIDERNIVPVAKGLGCAVVSGSVTVVGNAVAEGVVWRSPKGVQTDDEVDIQLPTLETDLNPEPIMTPSVDDPSVDSRLKNLEPYSRDKVVMDTITSRSTAYTVSYIRWKKDDAPSEDFQSFRKKYSLHWPD